MVEFSEDELNRLFRTLADWEEQLKDFDLDAEEFFS